MPRPDPATDTPEADGYVIDRVVTTESDATKKEPWPASTRDRIAAVRQAVEWLDRAAEPSDVAGLFSRAKTAEVTDVLDALDALGHVFVDESGNYTA